MSKLHLYVIPTDRPCATSLESYIPEIAKLSRRRRTHVLVLEDRKLPVDVTKAHRFALDHVLHSTSATGAVFTYKDWQAITGGGRWPSFLAPLLQDNAISYGRAFNKTTLIARALGASYIHRRDSDTNLPQVCKKWDLFPADIEVDIFEKTKCDIVGGNYWGDWNVALGPLADDPERLKIILSAHGIPQIGQESIIHNQIPRASQPPEHDAGEVTHGAYPDLGNCAMRVDVALMYPMPLAVNTIGTDYLFTGLAVRLNRAWLHGIRVGHKHSAERETLTYLKEYWLRRARQMDLLLILHKLDSKHRLVRTYKEQAGLLGDAILELSTVLENCQPERLVHWAAYIEAFRGTQLDESERICEYLKTNREKVQAQNEVAIAEYGELLRVWQGLSQHLIERIRTYIDDRPELQVPLEGFASRRRITKIHDNL